MKTKTKTKVVEEPTTPARPPEDFVTEQQFNKIKAVCDELRKDGICLRHIRATVDCLIDQLQGFTK